MWRRRSLTSATRAADLASRLGKIARWLRARSTALARLLDSGPVRQLVRSIYGMSVVERPARFAVGQLRPGAVRGYRVRETGYVAYVRHRSGDVEILNEIHATRIYDPPPPVQDVLSRCPADLQILDAGANIGVFTLLMAARYPQARITALEPDPDNAALASRALAANGLSERVVLLEACAGNAQGTVSFSAGEFYDSHVTEPGESGTIEVPSLDFFELARDAAYVKVDIEGSEWPILLDDRLPQLAARVVALEWHEQGCPGGGSESRAARRLREAGYEVATDPAVKPDAGTLWAWRP